MIAPGDLTARDAWLQKVLGVVRAGGGQDKLQAALARWESERSAVLAQLSALEKAIRVMNDPQSGPAIILVRAIMANITAKPADPKQVAELRRYLETDDIITDAEMDNGFGLTVRIRTPLSAALDAIERALAA